MGRQLVVNEVHDLCYTLDALSILSYMINNDIPLDLYNFEFSANNLSTKPNREVFGLQPDLQNYKRVVRVG